MPSCVVRRQFLLCLTAKPKLYHNSLHFHLHLILFLFIALPLSISTTVSTTSIPLLLLQQNIPHKLHPVFLFIDSPLTTPLWQSAPNNNHGPSRYYPGNEQGKHLLLTSCALKRHGLIMNWGWQSLQYVLCITMGVASCFLILRSGARWLKTKKLPFEAEDIASMPLFRLFVRLDNIIFTQ